MNIAVIIDKDLHEGGAYQYSLSLALFLREHSSEKYNFIFFTTIKQNIPFFRGYGIRCRYFNWSGIDDFFSYLSQAPLFSNIARKLRLPLNIKFDRIMARHQIGLVYFTGPSALSLAVENHNFIFTVLDLCFRDLMEFPEVYAEREFERREHLYSTALRKAVTVITDCALTKQNIVRRYNIDEERVGLFPFLPSKALDISTEEYARGYIDIRKKYNIPGDYIFYPAQFWPHKNHIYILEGLKLMQEKYNKTVNAVFCGSDKGNLRFVTRKAGDLGLGRQVFYIGFAEAREMPYLYKQALALVMPTYFGPTNMPPLEAFKFGCPVLYPGLPGFNEQLQGAVIPIHLNDPESMCTGLLKIIDGLPEVKNIIKNGSRRIEELARQDYWPGLKAFFDEYALKRHCWK